MIDILKSKYVQYGLFGAVLALVISVYIWNVSRLPTRLEFYVFDTKGNPAIFIRTPDDNRILINGGGNSGIIRELTNVLPFYSRRIDEVIVTSDSSDDVTGLIDVVNRYKVGSVILPRITAKESSFSSSTDKIYETFIDTVNQLKIPVERVSRGDAIDLARNNLVKLKAEILFPVSISANSTSPETESLNHTDFKYSKASPPEMIMRINYGATSFLLIGNASLKVQKFIASSSTTRSSVVSSDVLIVRHNVSSDSLSTNLINTVKPEFVIYSQVISNSKATSKSLATDPLYMIMSDHRFNLKQKNTIEVLSDGKSLEIK